MSGLDLALVIVLAVALAGILAYTIIKGIKKSWFKKLYETIKQAIKDAEKRGGTGVEKKAYVLEQVEKKCDELGIPYKLILGITEKLIDEIVEKHNIFIK